MKVNFSKPQPELQEGEVVQLWRTASENAEGTFNYTFHIARLDEEGMPQREYICSCKGFQYNGKCRHVDAVKQ